LKPKLANVIAIRDVAGIEPRINPMHTSSDIRNPLVQKGIPALGFGPLCGDLTQAGPTSEFLEQRVEQWDAEHQEPEAVHERAADQIDRDHKQQDHDRRHGQTGRPLGQVVGNLAAGRLPTGGTARRRRGA